MKRYLIFAFSTYYPCGGWNDFESSYESFPEALAYLEALKNKNDVDNAQIVDTETMKVAKEMYRSERMGKMVITDPEESDDD